MTWLIVGLIVGTPLGYEVRRRWGVYLDAIPAKLKTALGISA